MISTSAAPLPHDFHQPFHLWTTCIHPRATGTSGGADSTRKFHRSSNFAARLCNGGRTCRGRCRPKCYDSSHERKKSVCQERFHSTNCCSRNLHRPRPGGIFISCTRYFPYVYARCLP